MWMRLLSACGLAALMSVFCLPAPADDAKEENAKGKKASDVIPTSFRAFLVTDGRFSNIKTPEGVELPDPRNRTGKIHCLVCENGLAPVIAVFVRLRGDATKTLEPDKNVSDLIKKTNALIPKYRADKLASFVMFLRLESGTKTVTVKTTKDKMDVETKVEQDLEYPDENDEKREQYKADIKAFADMVGAPNVPFGLAAEKSKALSEWQRAVSEWQMKSKEDVEKAEITVVVYYRMRMVKSWTFENKDLTEDKVNEILHTAEEAITGKKK
jgi:hypothetical protein